MGELLGAFPVLQSSALLLPILPPRELLVSWGCAELGGLGSRAGLEEARPALGQCRCL